MEQGRCNGELCYDVMYKCKLRESPECDCGTSIVNATLNFVLPTKEIGRQFGGLHQSNLWLDSQDIDIYSNIKLNVIFCLNF